MMSMLRRIVVPLSCREFPQTDPTPIFEAFRGNYSTELLAAAVGHFHLFAELVGEPLSFDELRGRIGLAPRAANVFFTALCAMGLLTRDRAGQIALSELVST